jgi:hypothetical protein
MRATSRLTAGMEKAASFILPSIITKAVGKQI